MSHWPRTNKDGSILLFAYQFDMNIKVILKSMYYMYSVSSSPRRSRGKLNMVHAYVYTRRRRAEKFFGACPIYPYMYINITGSVGD